MNKIDIQQTGGFPLETDTLNAMQNAYDVFNSLGNIIASLAIVKGCEILGNNVANGVVYINGEVLEFRGGQAGATVIIREETQNKNFENGENKLVYRTRYATFGSSVQTTNYNWSDFHRSISLKEIEKRLVHVGFIQDYHGDVNAIPAGWHLCNGENGTPDLRGMFIVGYNPDNPDYNTIGKTGGAKEVTLTVNQLPKHTPTGSVTISDHTHSYQLAVKGRGYQTRSDDNPLGITQNAETSSAGGGTFNVSMNEIGDSKAHENRPPFFVLAKIMYKG